MYIYYIMSTPGEKITKLEEIKKEYNSDHHKRNLIDKLIKLLQIEESHDVAVRYLKDIDTKLHDDVNVCENNGTTILLDTFINRSGTSKVGGNRRNKKKLSRSKRYKSNRIKSKKYRKSRKSKKSKKSKKYVKSKKR